ncbi:uncharacterized protein BDV17DRAFT_288053 [Aspergillus undulatus]|uniref:uncharacterized protein n=1 Tax=Aspergillus undulatus TaxID=1810928 RepID=UPI003CCD8901
MERRELHERLIKEKVAKRFGLDVERQDFTHHMLQAASRGMIKLAIMLQDRSNQLIDMVEVRVVYDFRIEAFAEGLLQLAIRMHGLFPNSSAGECCTSFEDIYLGSFILQILVELPWQAILGVCTSASFYFSVYGETQDPQRQCLVLLFVVHFFLHASSFAHFVVAAVPNAVLGSMLALFMFVMSLLSNGIMQPPSTLPPFWNYMRRVSPLIYYVGGTSGTALHGREIHCSERETLAFDAPAGQTCGQYMEEYLKTAAGALINESATGQCHYCPLRSADQYLSDRDIFWHLRWRDYGILWAYFAFNILGAI